ncbi:insulinase family protein [Arthrobacter sp. SX1312]|uniref:insulinase family protein n=1 Tax=Arthrobacter sp. SX1312 TaxID=2058896 RepID=UPI000CE37351|nr:insulinase family protein [Arthrobacter sp. SX1312]
MTLNRAEVDGIPVFWVEGPPPLSAELVFRVGVRDESLVTSGITHLAEHLVMAGAPSPRYDHNATVELSFTSFEATGRPEQVIAFLGDICASIRTPDVSSLDIEKKVLVAEASSVVEPAVAEHLLRRYGLSSLGLAGVDQPALNSIDDSAVIAAISKYFTSGNAALALTGPPPPGLSLVLPPGEAQPPRAARPIASLPTPLWFELGGPPLALSFEFESGSELARNSASVIAQVACQRALDLLRRKRGIIYDVGHHVLEAGRGRGVVCLTADPRKEDAELALRELRSILDDLSSHGPDELELRQLTDDITDFAADPRSAAVAATDAARRYLLGEQLISPEQMVTDTAAVTRQSAQNALSLLDLTLMVGMPEGTSTSDPSLRMLGGENHEPVSGRSFKRSLRGSFQGVPSKARLVVGDDGVSLVDQAVTTIFWDDVRGLEYTPYGIALHGVDAVSLELQQSWFARGHEALALIEDRVDSALTYRVDIG